jgi:hypothetical protein
VSRHDREPSADSGWERRDVSIVGVTRFAIALFLGTALFMVLMWIMESRLTEREQRNNARVAPATRLTDEGPQRPPRPVLQGAPGSEVELVSPELELERLRDEEAELLGSYGWVDRDAGTVRLPVERAKEVMTERGFDVRPDSGDRP